MTHHLSVDIETYSDVDIKKAGLYKYAQSPAFDILLIAWAVDDGPVRIVDLTCLPRPLADAGDGLRAGQPSDLALRPFGRREDPGAEGSSREYQNLMDFLRDFYDPDTVRHAYNAAFEHYCLNVWLRRQGRATLQPGDWKCTMAHGQYCGYTAGLAATGEAMGLPADKKKLGIGAALIRKFCVPQKPNKTHPEPWRVRPVDEPEKWELFKTYCRQDVETEREIERRLSKWPMPVREQLLWELTTEANIEGVAVDMELVAGALDVGEREQAELIAEARALSGLDNPKSTQQLLKWLNTELDDEVTDLRKTTVAELLKAGVDSKKATRMLELRQLISKTSTKKYDAIQTAACADGRVRGMLAYYGANRTGRWAGRIVQPQNLPQNHLDGLDDARALVKARDLDMLRLCWGSVPDTLSQLIRTALIPSRGRRYAVADYSAIEARVVAWLAGETWVLDAFRAGKDIYCATASQMFGVPVEKHGVNGELRQRGKVATLALGYGGGEGALINMGALRMGIPEEDLPEIKDKWRRANPAICALWRRVEDAAVNTVKTGKASKVAVKISDPERARENERRMGAEPGSYSDQFRTGVDIIFRLEEDAATDQKFLTIQLPTRRKLFYAHPFLAPAKNFPDRESLHYYGMNQTTRKWAVTDTWGGKLVENITQAVARDCLAETLLALRRKGMTAVFHVHDETIVEVENDGQLDDILSVMATTPDWAPGLPLKGAGFVCDYYQKD